MLLLMKILVTGGAGYIGSTLVPMLLEKGHDVTVLDNFMYRQSSLLSVCKYPGLTIINNDVREEALLLKEVKKADVVIPLACLVGAPLCKKDPVGARSINFESIQNIINTMSSDQKLIFPTTNSGYGVGQEGIFCTEETPLNPISLYGVLKVDIENAILQSGKGITFRLATVFGASPRMRIDLLVNDFTYRAFKDRFIVLFESHFKRNFLHVRDASAAFIHGIENYDSMKGQPYNVGLSEANLSKLELCEAIKKEVGTFEIICSDIDADPDKRNYIVSNEKIEKTGFKAKVSIEEGVQELLKAYNSFPRHEFGNI